MTKVKRNLICAFLAIALVLSAVMLLSNSKGTRIAEAGGAGASGECVVDMSMHAVNDAFHICNDTPITQGDTVTMTVEFAYLNQISNTNANRFAHFIWYGNKESCWNASSTYGGVNCYLAGKWVTYANQPLMPYSTGDTFTITFTPQNEGANYRADYSYGAYSDYATKAYQPYMGIMLQGFTFDMVLNVSITGTSGTNYGVYAYAENAGTDYARTMSAADVTNLGNVAEVPATCSATGTSAYFHYTYNETEYKFGYSVLPVDPAAHTYENGVCMGCGIPFEIKDYVVESVMHTNNDAFHICNNAALHKGDTFTLEFTVFYLNNITPTLNYRYARVCEVATKDNCWNGSTTGVGVNLGGSPVTTGGPVRVLPWTNGMEIRIEFTPTDVSGDTYNWDYYENDVKVDYGTNRPFNTYMGIMVQGFVYDMILSDASFASNNMDFGIYSYAEAAVGDYSTTMAATGVSDLTVVNAVAVSCEAAGNNTYASYGYGGDTVYFNRTVTPALGHDYQAVAEVPATCEGTGVAAHYDCSRCDKHFTYDGVEYTEVSAGSLTIAATGHTYGEWIAEVPAQIGVAGSIAHYHCSACGKNFDAQDEELDSIAIAALDGIKWVSLSLNGDIGVNFYAYVGGAVTLTANSGALVGESVTKEGIDCFKFTVNVAAKDYKNNIAISIDGTAIEATYKVETYIDAITNESPAYDLVQSLKTYCEAARAFFADETPDAAAAVDIADENAASVSGSDDGIELVGATLILESKTAIKVYFKAADIGGKTFTVKGAAVVPAAVDGYDDLYMITIDNIAAVNLDTTYTIVVGGYTVSYSALSYAYAVVNNVESGVAIANVAKALYNYNVQADAYAAL